MKCVLYFAQFELKTKTKVTYFTLIIDKVKKAKFNMKWSIQNNTKVEQARHFAVRELDKKDNFLLMFVLSLFKLKKQPRGRI